VPRPFRARSRAILRRTSRRAAAASRLARRFQLPISFARALSHEQGATVAGAGARRTWVRVETAEVHTNGLGFACCVIKASIGFSCEKREEGQGISCSASASPRLVRRVSTGRDSAELSGRRPVILFSRFSRAGAVVGYSRTALQPRPPGPTPTTPTDTDRCTHAGADSPSSPHPPRARPKLPRPNKTTV
jgi:hypothetical protein